MSFKQRKKKEYTDAGKEVYNEMDIAGKSVRKRTQLHGKVKRMVGRSYMVAVYRFDMNTKRRAIKDAMHFLKNTFNGEFIQLIQDTKFDIRTGQPIISSHGIPMPQWVEIWRLPASDGYLFDTVKATLARHDIELYYGDDTLTQGRIPYNTFNPDNPAKQVLPKHCYSSAKAKALHKEMKEEHSKMDFLRFVYGEKPSLPITDKNRFEHMGYSLFMQATLPSISDSLNELSNELIGMNLPENWAEQSDFWLDKLDKWENLAVFHYRYAGKELGRLGDAGLSETPEYLYWIDKQSRMMQFVKDNDDMRTLAEIAKIPRPEIVSKTVKMLEIKQDSDMLDAKISEYLEYRSPFTRKVIVGKRWNDLTDAQKAEYERRWKLIPIDDFWQECQDIWTYTYLFADTE